uniref:Uncharacterized protein n=1 Tax=Lactuca sativa TaxID=4236 RepID=A0A9R1VDL9_LACSA|nr:hypothetical protein LSAT_V11C500283650 [Lactuca sativa]
MDHSVSVSKAGMCIMDVNEAGPRDTDTVIVINHEKIKQKKQPSKIQDNGIHGAREADNYCNPLRRQVLLHKCSAFPRIFSALLSYSSTSCTPY